jgi:ABC-type nitrate/sulfonate/bicarbonate transport system substrate-binding protein
LLKKWGLESDREVKVIQMGGQPEILAGMQAGVIHGGVLSSPGDFKAKKAGFSMLANFAKVGLDYPTTSLVSTRSTIKNDRETVKRFLMAYSEAVDRLFRDKELAMKVIGKWTRTQDREALESSYEYATNFIERPPRLPYKAIETILAQATETDPKARGAKPMSSWTPASTMSWKSGYLSRWGNSQNLRSLELVCSLAQHRSLK